MEYTVLNNLNNVNTYSGEKADNFNVDKSIGYASFHKPVDYISKDKFFNLRQQKKLLLSIIDKIPELRRYKSARIIYRKLISKYGDWRKAIRISHDEIAETCMVDKKTSQRVMQLLHDLKFIFKMRIGCKEINIYSINYDILKSYDVLLTRDLNDSIVKRHDVPLLIKAKALSSYNKYPNNTFNKVEEIKEEIPIEKSPPDPKKPFEMKNFTPSKKNQRILESHGLVSYLQKLPLIEQFIDIQEKRLYQGTQEWTHANANHLFEWFIRKELPLRDKQGGRYINPVRRSQWYYKKQAAVTKSVNAAAEEIIISEEQKINIDFKPRYLKTRADLDAERQAINATWSN